MDPDELRERLASFLQRSHEAAEVRIDELRLLTGGASRQTWSFDAVIEEAQGRSKTVPLVLRSNPRGGASFMAGELEYRLLKAAGEAGVLVPKVHLLGDDSLGMPFFLMERVEGETIARRLLRDDKYAGARENMAGQLAVELAKVHRIPIEENGLDVLPGPRPGQRTAEAEVDRYEQIYRAFTPDPHPALELGLRWLRERMPEGTGRALVHGDFRIGNVIFGPEGARSILDWELSHIGDPVEDIGWLCVRSWRFGNDDLPVGGIGAREDFYRAYQDAGGVAVDPERVRFWEAFGNLRWGVSCIIQAKAYLDGLSPSVELAAIGRRIAETEWELLNLMEGA